MMGGWVRAFPAGHDLLIVGLAFPVEKRESFLDSIDLVQWANEETIHICHPR